MKLQSGNPALARVRQTGMTQEPCHGQLPALLLAKVLVLAVALRRQRLD